MTTALGPVLRTWRSVLPAAEVGPDTDFFDAGGHSLLAVKLAAHLAAALGTPVLAKDVLRARTPRRLAESLPEPPAG